MIITRIFVHAFLTRGSFVLNDHRSLLKLHFIITSYSDVVAFYKSPRTFMQDSIICNKLIRDSYKNYRYSFGKLINNFEVRHH